MLLLSSLDRDAIFCLHLCVVLLRCRVLYSVVVCPWIRQTLVTVHAALRLVAMGQLYRLRRAMRFCRRRWSHRHVMLRTAHISLATHGCRSGRIGRRAPCTATCLLVHRQQRSRRCRRAGGVTIHVWLVIDRILPRCVTGSWSGGVSPLLLRGLHAVCVHRCCRLVVLLCVRLFLRHFWSEWPQGCSVGGTRVEPPHLSTRRLPWVHAGGGRHTLCLLLVRYPAAASLVWLWWVMRLGASRVPKLCEPVDQSSRVLGLLCDTARG